MAGRALACERSAAQQTKDAEAYGKTVWSWRPWLASSRRRRCKTRPGAHAVNSPMTEAKGIRLRGERGISRQTIAQGMPECSDCTCMLVCASTLSLARETAGAASTRHSLRPLSLGETVCKARARNAPREGEGVCVFESATPSAVIVREGGRSSIPEAAVIEPIGRSVLDTPPARGTTSWVPGESLDSMRGCERFALE
jgi:hypothetical protein